MRKQFIIQNEINKVRRSRHNKSAYKIKFEANKIEHNLGNREIKSKQWGAYHFLLKLIVLF